jgi:hypothetical protein
LAVGDAFVPGCPNDLAVAAADIVVATRMPRQEQCRGGRTFRQMRKA